MTNDYSLTLSKLVFWVMSILHSQGDVKLSLCLPDIRFVIASLNAQSVSRYRDTLLGVSKVMLVMCEVSVDLTLAGCLFLEISLLFQGS